MSKTTDDRHDATEPAEKLRRLPVVVDDHGRSIVARAILLKRASEGDTGGSSPAEDGEILAQIVVEWLASEAVRLRGGGA